MTGDIAVHTLEELERIHGYKIDAILPDGTHRYWSTHCRHARFQRDPGHLACSATVLIGADPYGEGDAAIRRTPANCKTCSAPCVCPCHSEVLGG